MKLGRELLSDCVFRFHPDYIFCTAQLFVTSLGKLWYIISVIQTNWFAVMCHHHHDLSEDSYTDCLVKVQYFWEVSS